MRSRNNILGSAKECYKHSIRGASLGSQDTIVYPDRGTTSGRDPAPDQSNSHTKVHPGEPGSVLRFLSEAWMTHRQLRHWEVLPTWVNSWNWSPRALYRPCRHLARLGGLLWASPPSCITFWVSQGRNASPRGISDSSYQHITGARHIWLLALTSDSLQLQINSNSRVYDNLFWNFTHVYIPIQRHAHNYT